MEDEITIMLKNASLMLAAQNGPIERSFELGEAIRNLLALRSQGKYCPQEALDAAEARLDAARKGRGHPE